MEFVYLELIDPRVPGKNRNVSLSSGWESWIWTQEKKLHDELQQRHGDQGQIGPIVVLNTVF